VSTSKLKNNLPLDVTKRTIQHELKDMKYSYQAVAKEISFTAAQKKLQMKLVREWIASDNSWQITVFTDETVFFR